MTQPVCINCNGELTMGKCSHEEPKDNKVTEVFCMTCAINFNDRGTCICGESLIDREIRILDPTVRSVRGVRFRLPDKPPTQPAVAPVPKLEPSPVQDPEQSDDASFSSGSNGIHVCGNNLLGIVCLVAGVGVISIPYLFCGAAYPNTWWNAC